MSSRKILVTGATGFIGSRLVRKLLTEENQVYALVRKSSNLELFSDIADKIHLVEGDITVADSLKKPFDGIDQLYHCAGYIYQGCSKDKIALLHSINVDGTRNVMEASLDAKIDRVVHLSSIMAIGITCKHCKPMDETFRWNFDTIGLYYAKSKKQSEEEVLKAKEKGLNCVIVNPAFVFGAGDVNFNSGKLIKDLYYNKLPFYPLGGICVVDVEIVVETIIRAMEVGRIGERYIIGGDNLSYKELSDIISKVIGINMSIKPLPYPVATVLYKLLLLLDTKKYFNITLFRIASEFMYFSPEKAIRELGMRTEPIEYSIQRALDWYKKNKLL